MKVVAVCRNKEQVKDPRVFVIENTNASWSSIYNLVLDKGVGDIIVFLGENGIISDQLDKALDIFNNYPYIVGAVYGDGKIPLPSYNQSIDTYFAFNASLVKEYRFADTWSISLYQDFLHNLNQKYLVYHLPERIFV